VRIEVEVERVDQIAEAVHAGADVLLLDNMDDATLTEAVRVARALSDRVLLEASGNMTAERVAAIRDVGVDLVSVGGLIHQARWVDLSLRLEP
jgi:nicotinate-nucleotide pyrophosphorylase (carboxylating)